jgi:peptide/nickel transport system substrate-binding protein
MFGKKVWAIFILAVIVLVGLMACTAPAEKVLATPGGGGTPIVLPTATPLGAEVKPIPGGVYRGYFTVDPSYWSPNGGTAGAIGELNRVGGPLLQFNFGPKYDSWNFDFSTNSIAQSWEISKDGLTYTFHLRQGVLWQNKPPLNGRELVAEDVKFTYELHMKTAGAPRREQLSSTIQSIECPDKYTVVIHLKEPRPDFLLTLATPYCELVAPELVQAFGDLNTPKAAVSFGPFMLEEYVPSVRIVYKKNPTYYRAKEGLPYLDGLYYFNIADESTSLAAFRAEQIDLRTVARIDLASVKQSNPNVYCYENEIRADVTALAFRTDKTPFSDVRVRRAVALAINRKEVINTFYYGYADAQLGPIHTSSSWYLKDVGEYAKYQQYNPEEAKRLVVEAGYPGGLSIDFTVNSAGGIMYLDYCQYVADALSKIGIKATLKPLESGAFYSVVYNQKAYAAMTFLTVWAGGTFGPDIWLNQIYGKGYGSNYSLVDDPKLEPMLTAQTTEMDPVKRKEIIDEIQRYLVGQAYYVYGHHDYAITCLQPWVRDYKTHAAAYHTGRIAELMWLTPDAPGRK